MNHLPLPNFDYNDVKNRKLNIRLAETPHEFNTSVRGIRRVLKQIAYTPSQSGL